MTEAEELELLELEELEAKGAAVAPTKELSTLDQAVAQLKSENRSAERAGLQGFTADFSDELGGAGTAAMQAATNYLLPKALKRRLDLVDAPVGEAYSSSRDQSRADDAAAKDANPDIYRNMELAGAIAMPIPGGNAAKGAKFLQRAAHAAKHGSLVGGVYGLGSSEADSVDGAAVDAAVGMGAGALGGVAGEIPGGIARAIRGRAQRGIDAAVEKQTGREVLKKETEIRAAAGALGGETAATLKTLERLTETLGDTSAPPEIRAAAQKALEDPRFQEALNKARQEYAAKAPEQLGRLESGRVKLDAAKAKDVVAATEEALSNPIRKHVLRRALAMAHRAAPGALMGAGAIFGGTEGALIGAGAGTAVSFLKGGDGRMLVNMVKEPAVRRLFWESVLSTFGGKNPEAKLVVQSLEQAAQKSPQAFAATLDELAQRWPVAQSIKAQLAEMATPDETDERTASK
jgi:hypothetical protein